VLISLPGMNAMSVPETEFLSFGGVAAVTAMSVPEIEFQSFGGVESVTAGYNNVGCWC
jgi:hypothetical protein